MYEFKIYLANNMDIILLGIYLMLGWFTCIFIAFIGKYVWAWIDDSKASKQNPFLHFIATHLGYKYNKQYEVDSSMEKFIHFVVNPDVDDQYGQREWAYVKWDKDENRIAKSDGARFIFVPAGVLLAAPFSFLLGMYFYTTALIIITTIAIAHLSRFVRRLSKTFKKHVTDPDAHKEKAL